MVSTNRSILSRPSAAFANLTFDRRRIGTGSGFRRDRYGASFVSVTQTFDTSDSMGRLVLNILLTFAQLERELASERIRDRGGLRRARGLFVGGMTPTG